MIKNIKLYYYNALFSLYIKMGIMYNKTAKEYIAKSNNLSKKANAILNKMIAIEPELEKYI